MEQTTPPCVQCTRPLPPRAATGARRKFCDECRRWRKLVHSVRANERAKERRHERLAAIAEPRACPQCGAFFSFTGGTKVYCTERCSSRAYDARKRRTMYERSCPQCAGSFVTRVKSQAHCSRRCSGMAAGGELRPADCVVCGTEFLGRSRRGRKTCSRACHLWAKRFPGIPFVPRCGRCFQEFEASKKGQIYCSTRCSRAVMAARRRARLVGAPYETVVPLEIFERDNWICRICDDPIDPSLNNYHPLMATLDHVVPVASSDYLGHTAANLAAAHFICNNRKRHRSLAHIRAIIARERLEATAA